jgi:hypothetical protein
MPTRLELIETLEQEIGHALPAEYRAFLLAGPLPVWNDEFEPENQATYILHSFHDVGRGDETDLLQVWRERDSQLPDWFFEFAEIYDGVKLGVGLTGPQTGKVYSFSWDSGEEELQADSFDSFLNRLREDEQHWDKP